MGIFHFHLNCYYFWANALADPKFGRSGDAFSQVQGKGGNPFAFMQFSA